MFRARNRVIHQGPGDHLSRIGVVIRVLEERLAVSLRYPTMCLAMEDHGVYGTSDISDSRGCNDLESAGFRINFDFAHLGAVWVAWHLHCFLLLS